MGAASVLSTARRDVSLGAGLEHEPAKDPKVKNGPLGGVREGSAELRPESALVALGGVREGRAELRVGNEDALGAVNGVADASVLPHGLRISLGVEVATEGVVEAGWKPDIRVWGLTREDEVPTLALEDSCAIITLRFTLI